MVKKVCRELNDKKLNHILTRRDYEDILTRVSVPDLMNSNCLSFLSIYHKKKDKSYHLEKPFSKGKHVRLLKTVEKPYIAKWYKSGSRTAAYEIEVYKKLKSLGCPLPYFSGDYLFWEEPVLVMEELLPLEAGKEDVYKLGRQVLIQLTYLHNFGVHCDIKPDNILKRENDKSTTYYLIDFGGVAQEKLSWGYKRWIWSKHWTSQKPHSRKQIASPKHDFKELAFTLNAIKNPGIDHREKFSGRLKKFRQRIDEVNKRKVLPKDYEDLIKILS